MSQWYLSKDGQALGPVETNQVKALIKAKDLTPLDLVYKAGESNWVPLSEVDEFSSLFSDESDPKSEVQSGEKEWVLLKKVETDKGKDYKQLGPYSKEEVLDLVDKGEFKFSDFAWRKGMEAWAKIADIEEFDRPLASSPNIDVGLYEKSKTGIEVSDPEQDEKNNISHLVNIETFEYEKTQVVNSKTRRKPLRPQSEAKPVEVDSSEELDKTKVSIPKRGKQASAESSEAMDRTRVSMGSKETTTTEEDSLAKTQVSPRSQRRVEEEDLDKTQVTHTGAAAPINTQDFVTESQSIDTGDDSEEASLWALESPKVDKKFDRLGESSLNALEHTVIRPTKSKNKKDLAVDKNRPRPAKASGAYKKGPRRKKPLISNDALMYMLVGIFFAISALAFYYSFKPAPVEVVYDENIELRQDPPPMQEPLREPTEENFSTEPTMDRQPQSESSQVSAVNPSEETSEPEPVKAQLPTRDVVKSQQVKQESKPAVAQAQAKPKKVVEKPTIKKQPVVQVKKVLPRAPASAAKVDLKKNKINKQTEIMKRTKKAATPSSGGATPSRKRQPSSKVAVVQGGSKTKSFYKQRDRKALFYSSLKAETLAVEIEREFKKLKENKRAWSNYYRQWRKKVNVSLASEIRSFPKSSEKYAYPDQISRFKKDYDLFLKYGETFDAKVKGARQPSGAPDDMQKVFARHKQVAKGLGN